MPSRARTHGGGGSRGGIHEQRRPVRVEHPFHPCHPPIRPTGPAVSRPITLLFAAPGFEGELDRHSRVAAGHPRSRCPAPPGRPRRAGGRSTRRACLIPSLATSEEGRCRHSWRFAVLRGVPGDASRDRDSCKPRDRRPRRRWTPRARSPAETAAALAPQSPRSQTSGTDRDGGRLSHRSAGSSVVTGAVRRRGPALAGPRPRRRPPGRSSTRLISPGSDTMTIAKLLEVLEAMTSTDEETEGPGREGRPRRS